MKKKLILLTSLLSLVQFNGFTNDLELLNGDFTIGYEGEINANSSISNRSATGVNLEDSFISLNAEWRNKVRAVITGNLETVLRDNQLELNDDFSIAEFIEEAYIEIKEIKGTPVAIIVGKAPIAFGQNVQASPVFNNNPLTELQEKTEVFGVTIDFTEGLFGLFDQAEISIFETEEGDLEIGNIDGISFKVSKSLTDNILLSASHLEASNNHLQSGHERRSSLGLIVESTDGALVGWVEGIYFSNNPEYPNSSFAITAGTKVRVSRTSDVILEYSYINNSVSQVAIGVKTAITKNTTAGIEVRYNNYLDGRESEFILGLNANYAFGSHGEPVHEEYIFGRGQK